MAKLREQDMPEEAYYEMLNFNTQGVQRLMAYLVEEHRQALVAHEEYFNELKVLRRAIAGKPAVRVKTFPWPGASNLVLPLIRIAGDAVKARIVNTLLGPRPFWICSAASGTAFAPYAAAWQKFLEWAVANDLSLVDEVERISDQVVFLGKCPVKHHWWHEVKKIRTYDPKTKKEVYKVRVTRDQPTLTPILLENWLEPWGLEASIEKPWNSQRVFLRVGDLIEREKMGLIKNADKVIESYLSHVPENLREAQELHKLAWCESQQAQLYETCVLFDVDGDGFREECFVLWHYESGTPLSVKYNFFWHGNRPLEMLFYMKHGDNDSTADGIAHMLYPLQEAISSFVNQRSDNITIANTRFFIGRRGSGLKKGEQVWPGKLFMLEDPRNDLIAEKLGDVSPSSFTHESILRDYAERLSGISDPQLGREFDNPRVAATTTLSVLQEGNRRFDMVIRIMRAAFGRIGIRVSQLYQQFKPRIPLGEILAPEDEIYVQEILNMSPEQVEKHFVISVNTSTAAVNKETQRQGLLALFNLLTQFYAQILKVAMQLMINPQIPEPIKDMVVDMAQASYNTLKQVVESYDINDAQSFLIDIAAALDDVRRGVATVESAEVSMQQGLEQFAGAAGLDPQALSGVESKPESPFSQAQMQPAAQAIS